MQYTMHHTEPVTRFASISGDESLFRGLSSVDDERPSVRGLSRSRVGCIPRPPSIRLQERIRDTVVCSEGLWKVLFRILTYLQLADGAFADKMDCLG